MYDKFLNAVLTMGTPNRWPSILRKLFVILFPITIPLLLAYWFAMIFVVIGVSVLVIIGCIVAEGAFALRDLWIKV